MAPVAFADAFDMYASIGHATSFFFLLAALWSDLLLIRLWLVLAHIFLLVSWLWAPGQVIFLDMAIWTFVTMCFHMFALYRHITDEVQQDFADKFDEQLWHFFSRRCGMHQQEFFLIMKDAERCTIGKGQVIMTEGSNLFYFHLLVQGVVSYTIGTDTATYQYRSGDLFNTEIGNVFGVHIGFSESLRAWTETDCILVRWPYRAMIEMSRMSPSVGGYWRNLLLFTLGQRLRRREHLTDDILAGEERSVVEDDTTKGLMELIGSVDSHGVPEEESWLQGGRSRDFTAEYNDEELAQETRGAHYFFKWFWSSFGPFPPPGARHYTLPEVAQSADRDAESRLKIVQAVSRRLTHAERKTDRQTARRGSWLETLKDTARRASQGSIKSGSLKSDAEGSNQLKWPSSGSSQT